MNTLEKLFFIFLVCAFIVSFALTIIVVHLAG